MNKVEIGPTGSTIQGDILDVNKKHLEKALQFYDPLLYLVWNPKKQRGMGIWELRRRPDSKSVIETIKHQGETYHILGYKESELVHHVKDIPVLGYHVLQWLKDSDTFSQSGYEAGKQHRMTKYIDDMDETAFQVKYQQQERAKKEMVYNLMQDKKVFKDFQESVNSGMNPAHLMRHWKR